MKAPTGGILGGSRREILGLLGAADRRVGELAEALGISENAVRVHLAALEDEGLVRHAPVRGGVGKPAHLYRIAPAGEALLSRAYLPFLLQMLDALRGRLDGAEMASLFHEVGRRLAPADRPVGDPRSRAEAAVRLLVGLGGAAYVDEDGGALVIRSRCCPLGAIAPAHPLTCEAVGTTLTEFMGIPVRADCDLAGRPRCRFSVGGEAVGSADDGGPPAA
jgi:predicted ArsR family transcriptional regulator